MGKHNLDLSVDPWRSDRSFSFAGFLELGPSDRSLHQTCSFGKPRVSPLRLISLLLRTMGRVVEVTRIPKKKQPAFTGRAVLIFRHFCLNHALGASLLPFAVNAFRPVEASGNTCGPGVESVDREVTWLILPVVICLSQRLSHACLSINNFIL